MHTMLMSNWAFKDWTHETKTKFFPTKPSNQITIACTRMNRMNSRRKPQYDCISSTDKVKLKDYRWLTVLRSKLEIERKCIGDVLRKAYGLIVDVACVSFDFSRYMSSTHVCEWVSRVCWSILCKKMERKRERQETTKTPNQNNTKLWKFGIAEEQRKAHGVRFICTWKLPTNVYTVISLIMCFVCWVF